jgi:hypothetical protein
VSTPPHCYHQADQTFLNEHLNNSNYIRSKECALAELFLKAMKSREVEEVSHLLFAVVFCILWYRYIWLFVVDGRSETMRGLKLLGQRHSEFGQEIVGREWSEQLVSVLVF